MASAGSLWIGTSGYVYKHWRGGVFYPPKLVIKNELAYYASVFSTVEINTTFYKPRTVNHEPELERPCAAKLSA